MKIVENITNIEKAKPFTTVVDPVLDIAVKEDEEIQKETKDLIDPEVRAKEKPFLGAEDQKTPEEPEEFKIQLEESLFEEDYTDPRYYTDMFFDMIDEGLVDPVEMLKDIIYWVSEDDMKEFMRVRDSLPEEEDLEETLLTEKQWKEKLESGSALRAAINNAEDEEGYQEVVDRLKDCYSELLDKGLIEEDDFESWTDELEWMDLDEDSLDYELSEFYDLCDNLDVWVSLEEVEDEE